MHWRGIFEPGVLLSSSFQPRNNACIISIVGNLWQGICYRELACDVLRRAWCCTVSPSVRSHGLVIVVFFSSKDERRKGLPRERTSSLAVLPSLPFTKIASPSLVKSPRSCCSFIPREISRKVATPGGALRNHSTCQPLRRQSTPPRRLCRSWELTC